ncbi:hypothetical protein LguiB_017779 [Lonicera macranthoides]
MDDILITTLVDQVLSKSRKVDNVFKSEELAPLITQLHTLFQISGFGLDENMGRITVDPSAWDEYTKTNPNLSKLRGSNTNDDISIDKNELEEDEILPNPSVTSKCATKGGGSTEEDIAFSVIAESSKQIAEAIKTYTSQKKIGW